MDHSDYNFDVAALAEGAGPVHSPVVVLDLDRIDPCDPACRRLSLPPCPVIGLGDSRHPLAAQADCLVEPPVRLDGLIAAIRARPLAASVLVQLLRLIEGMDPARALVAESLAYATLQGGDEHTRWLAERRTAPKDHPAGRLHVTRKDDVLHLEMDRPGTHNAIDAPLRDALREALDLAVLDPTIARVELRGGGRAFGVGADLAEFGTTRDPARAHAIRMQTLPALAAVRCGERLVSRVQGLCVGASLELAAFGRIEARRDAIFHLPELAMGLLPGAGGCVSLSRRIGRQRTALMVLSGRRIGVETALAWGLADSCVDALVH
ncbi:enoyl-CoA hydratase/isomerase family protein [Novosphingobium sp. MBES04]|uniref:enoyl-CoA hydratase/isomerase family protein n=1 Tax=Novosphingobium sp. MBES04 TaxID=1206458 RepID=UPI001F593D71|nr:enoyl-CoA hydratase/isomerase family protein [Novosphingobium sp. MBES04]